MVTLKDKAYREIKTLILEGKLEPGEFLVERNLVERLQMSRTPVRSALERLEVEGMVKLSPKQGIIVERMSIEQALDIFDLRQALESHICKKLSERTLSSEESAKIQAILDEQKLHMEKEDFSEFSKMDFEFHLALAEIYDNKKVEQILHQIREKLCLIAVDVMKKRTARINVAYEEHVRIYRYMLEGKSEEASKEMVEHLEFGKNILLSK